MLKSTVLISCVVFGIEIGAPVLGRNQSIAFAGNEDAAPAAPEDPRLEPLTKKVVELQHEVDRLAERLEAASQGSRIAELEAVNAELKRALDAERAKSAELVKEVEGLRSAKHLPAKLAPKKDVQPKPIDIVIAGKTWRGNRYPNKGPSILPWEVRVKKRSGNTFTGEVWIGRDKKGDDRVYEFSGTLSDPDKIEIETKKKSGDPFLQTYRGTIEGTKISFTFSGTTYHGNDRGGTADLARVE